MAAVAMAIASLLRDTPSPRLRSEWDEVRTSMRAALSAGGRRRLQPMLDQVQRCYEEGRACCASLWPDMSAVGCTRCRGLAFACCSTSSTA